MSLVKLMKYLKRENRVKPLSHELTTPYDPLKVEWDDLLVMMTGKAKDPMVVRRLKSHYKAKTALTLIPLLPARRRPSLHTRIRTWFQRLEGSYASDPYRMELRRARQKKAGKWGYSETRIPLKIRMKEDETR